MFTRMPFGIKSTPSAFQKMMLGLVGAAEGTLVYLDDILIAGSDRETLQERVKEVRRKLETAAIKINEGKSENLAEKVDWLGFELSASGIRPTEEKTGQIICLQVPRNRKEVKQVMGGDQLLWKIHRKLGPQGQAPYMIS